jgi:hypothetical protein
LEDDADDARDDDAEDDNAEDMPAKTIPKERTRAKTKLDQKIKMKSFFTLPS